MEKIIDQVHGSLQRLVGFHRQLLDTVRLEKDALITADVKAIQEITAHKQGLLELIRQEEIKRTYHVQLLLEVLARQGRPVAEVTLTHLIIAVQGDDLKRADALRSVQNALVILAKRISDQNLDNQKLTARSLEHIGQMKRNILGESGSRSGTYNQPGTRAPGPGGARLISKEA